MKRAALIVLATGLLAGPAVAATPHWTATGAITKLNKQVVTVHGKTCKIPAALRTVVKLYYVGAGAKINCVDGSLRKIDVLNVLPAINQPGPAHPSTQPSPVGSSAFLMGSTLLNGASAVYSTTGMVGNFSITALDGGSITTGSGKLSMTCRLGGDSPDLSGFQVGDKLSDARCKNGVLTSITRA